MSYELSSGLPALLEQLDLSLLLSTYRGGRVVSIGSHQDQPRDRPTHQARGGARHCISGPQLPSHRAADGERLHMGNGRLWPCLRECAGRDSHFKWRLHHKTTGGCLIHLPTGGVVLRGLAMPYSSRLYHGNRAPSDIGTDGPDRVVCAT